MPDAVPSRRRHTAPLPIAIDRDSATPLFRQIYQGIREAILSGRLVSGSRVPPSRELAADLDVSRATAVLAIETLGSEGFLEAHGAAGTYVADLRLPAVTTARERSHLVAANISFEKAGDALLRSNAVAFRLGEPALDLFPSKLWARLYSRSARTERRSLLGYGDPNGYLPLRRAIADYVAVSRSIVATADQVILVRGAQHAVDLAARLLLKPGDAVWVEDPGYLTPRTLLEMAGAKLVPVPVDREGLDVEEGIRRQSDARMACVAPSNHFPLGSTLSLRRRLALLEWAATADAWILEDDFDSEFRYEGSPLASLQGLDRNGRVIYVGTFSKTVYPALRLGYLIMPSAVAERFRSAAADVDHTSPTLEQATLARFIEEGHFTRHIRRMRAAYEERQQVLLDVVAEELGDVLRVDRANTGMHSVGWLAKGANDVVVERLAALRGIEVRALSRYCMRAPMPPALILGFAAVSPRQLRGGVRALRPLLSQP